MPTVHLTNQACIHNRLLHGGREAIYQRLYEPNLCVQKDSIIILKLCASIMTWWCLVLSSLAVIFIVLL